ncbi:tumor protein 63 [Pleuronectes platessa]|uniref:tumor protein 63 n=1 Tax=Pleuronectes platessa TaxID=8262 RepID=UPI00232A2DF3|nr:tumor protein 63 [Pleuronectes platessa]
MNSPYTAVQYSPEFPLYRPRDPSSRLSWRESSFLTAMSQNQSAQTTEFFSQDVFNQLFDMLDQSAIHSVQPIELNFTDSPTDGSTGNTIQISMDCITMHKPDETLSVRGLCSLELVINGPTPTAHFPLHQRGVWCADWHASNSASIRVGAKSSLPWRRANHQAPVVLTKCLFW